MPLEELVFLLCALCAFLGTTILVFIGDGKHQGRVSFKTIISLVIVSMGIFGLTIFGVIFGICGEASWLDMLFAKSLGKGICTLNVPISYGVVTSAVALTLWNGIVSLYRFIRM